MSRASIFFLFALLAVTRSLADDSPPTNADLFEPTDEWQSILPGQHIPAGLEVRVDLSSGERLARKLQTSPRGGDAADRRAVALLPGAPALTIDEIDQATESETHAVDDDLLDAHAKVIETLPPDARKLAEVLLGLPESRPAIAEILASGATGAPLAQRLRAVWVRRQAELQEAMAGMKTEGQIIQGLLSDLVSEPDSGNGTAAAARGTSAEVVEKKVSLLRDLEFHVSSVINAEDFVTMGGLPVLFSAMESDPSLSVAYHAAWVLGTAVKNHPPLQANATRLGAVWALVQLLRRGTSAAAELSLATSHLVAPGPYPATLAARADAAISRLGEGDATLPLQALAKGVYALGALLRRCPEAQSEFDRLGGGGVLGDVLQTAVTESWYGRASVRSRAVALHVDEPHLPGSPVQRLGEKLEAETRGNRRLVHAGRTLCAKTLTLLADLHNDVTLAEAEAAEAAAFSGPASFQIGKVKVTVKEDAAVGPGVGGGASALVSLVSPQASLREKLCARVREALALEATTAGCLASAPDALPELLREQYAAAVPEGEQRQSAALSEALSYAHSIVAVACD